jgi:hypothetical protein
MKEHRKNVSHAGRNPMSGYTYGSVGIRMDTTWPDWKLYPRSKILEFSIISVFSVASFLSGQWVDYCSECVCKLQAVAPLTVIPAECCSYLLLRPKNYGRQVPFIQIPKLMRCVTRIPDGIRRAMKCEFCSWSTPTLRAC